MLHIKCYISLYQLPTSPNLNFGRTTKSFLWPKNYGFESYFSDPEDDDENPTQDKTHEHIDRDPHSSDVLGKLISRSFFMQVEPIIRRVR